MKNQKPREIAVRILKRWENSREYLETAAEAELAAAKISPVDRGLAQELTRGSVRWKGTLDWLIARKTGGRAQKPALQWLLRLGLYQIFWLNKVPDHAAVFETVQMAKDLGFGPQSGFVNAVLRGCLREEQEIRQLLENLKASDPALAYSHPAWLFERWQSRWGREKAVQLMEWNNLPPLTFARVNTLKTDPGKLIERWREEGVSYDFFRRDWTGENAAFVLKEHPPLASLPSFRDGWFYVQDPSTLAAPRELAAQPGESVLDLCAAPGGKTTFIAQEMNNTGEIVAQDVSPDRLRLLRENCERLDARIVEAARSPESIFPELTRQFDRVLVDAPCSNTGVMRRRVDLRWRIHETEIQRLRELQRELLARGAAQARPGGVIVYSTCSLEPEENSEQVHRFLSENPGYILERERTLLPFAEGVDGAYVARLIRRD